MLFNSNKEKGNAGLSLAIGYYGSNGYTVSLPLNDTQDYDLIVDKDQKLYKVQVKATSQRSSQGYSIVQVSSSGGTNGQVYKTVSDTDIDILFVVTELCEFYEIPIEEIYQSRTINLGPDKQTFRVDFLSNSYLPKEKEKEKKDKFCSHCGSPINPRNQRGLCLICAQEKQRKVQRPDKETLIKELKESNFTQVGKKYGVSDNAVRKWCKNYGLSTKSKDYK